MPYIQIDSDSTLTHTQLINSYSRIVHKLHPSNYSSCYTFKTPYISSCRTYFAKVHSHAATKFAYHGKVIDTAVDTF